LCQRSEIESAIKLEKSLKDNSGELKTKFITFDLKSYMRVIENENKYDEYKLYLLLLRS